MTGCQIVCLCAGKKGQGLRGSQEAELGKCERTQSDLKQQSRSRVKLHFHSLKYNKVILH